MCGTFCILCCFATVDVDSMTDAFEKSKKSSSPDNSYEYREEFSYSKKTDYSETDSLLRKTQKQNKPPPIIRANTYIGNRSGSGKVDID